MLRRVTRSESSTLRAALLAWLATDVDAAARVTVLGEDLLSAALPERVSGLVAMNVIGHFAPSDRTRLWSMLATALTPRGRAVVNLPPPHRPEVVPLRPLPEMRIGDRVYTGATTAEPSGPDSVTWRMTYRVLDKGEQVSELTAADQWYVLTPRQLAAELAEQGLRVDAGDAEHGVHVITR